VDRIRTKTAQLHGVVCEIVDFETASDAMRERETLPAKPIVYGQLRGNLPAVAGIKAVAPHPLLDLFGELAGLARIGRQAQQERCECVVVVAGRSAVELRGSLGELETAGAGRI